MSIDYQEKFERIAAQTMFASLDESEQRAVRAVAFAHRLTFQELRRVVEAGIDLATWREDGIDAWIASTSARDKAALLAELDAHLKQLRRQAKSYPAYTSFRPVARKRQPVVDRETDKSIFGMCPVASPRTVCCNLRTIDAVENCVFGCSYCAVQTFYQDEIVFDADFADKLDRIELDPNRNYHIGTGQASDSLAWGNKHGVLDALIAFARKHPNVLLELKTKSDNVGYIVDSNVPGNIVCSWSLNTDVIVENEEHFTASLERRLSAARRVADAGVPVAFHFHPMVYYDTWREDYTSLAIRLVQTFTTDEVSFLSMGSVTMIKPVIKQIRGLGNPTKMLQMEFVRDPHGKFTYPDDIKVEMFAAMYDALSPWRDDVFMYLCMEKADIWTRALGYTWPDNETFEQAFARSAMPSVR